MIRKINLSDVEDLQKINAKSLGYPVSIELTKKQLEKVVRDDKHHYLVGYEDDKTGHIVGYIHAEVYDNLYSETLFNILGLAVLKENQRQKIGQQLMESMEKEALLRGIHLIRLNSGANRKNAHLFYESLGYDGSKEQKRFIKNLKKIAEEKIDD
ncbi:GNAT family N-acetyltransferase [Vagococcus martis]